MSITGARAILAGTGVPGSDFTLTRPIGELFQSDDSGSYMSNGDGTWVYMMAVPSYAENPMVPNLLVGGGSSGIAYAAQEGALTQIGRLTFSRGVVDITDLGGRTGTVSLGSQDGIPSKNIVVPVAITNAGALVAGLVAIHLNGENFTRLYKTVSGSLVELTNADISATFQITFAAVLY